MEFISLIPFPTKIAILFLVIIPAIVVGILRLTLYNRLQEMNSRTSRLLLGGDAEGIQPPIVDRLRTRYQKASKVLEHVNTIALIDSVYQDETISYSNLKIQVDRADGITRVLPNLLIAFGLIGTFLGITSNLTTISTIVTSFSQNNPNIGGLVQGLQKPLEDMGTAFSASLFGLLFGSILTIVNTIYNTGIAKYQLIASLEDYLDNIYKPTVEGNTRLDAAIDRMVDQQQEFLTRFHENVGAVLERSFGKAADRIADECSRINQIAENVYTNFSNAAGTIYTGANTFQQAASILEHQAQNSTDFIHEFKSGIEVFKLTADRIETTNIIESLDRVLVELNTNQQAFTNSTKTLEDSLVGITTSNQIATQLAQQVYETWQESTTQIIAASETISAGAGIFQQTANALEGQTEIILELIPQFQTGVDAFGAAADRIQTNNIIKDLDAILTNLNTTQAAFSSSTQTLSVGVEGMMSSHQQTNISIDRVYQELESATSKLQQGATDLINAAHIIRDSSLAIDLTNAADRWQNAQSEFNNSTIIFSQSAKDIQPVAAKLEPAIISIDRATNTLQQFGLEVVSLSKHNSQISESTQAAIAGFDLNYQKILNSTELSIQDIGTANRANWQSLVNILEPKIQADRESLQRLLSVIEKLEIIVSGINGVNSDSGISRKN